MISQRTLSRTVQVDGSGLHGNRPVRLTLQPAEADSGVVLCRTDLRPVAEIRVCLEHLLTDSVPVTLGRDGVRVSGVGQLLTALSCLGIDNARVELDGPELPLLDGEAGFIVRLIQSAGVERQPAGKRFIRVLRRVSVSDEDRFAQLEPFDGFSISLGMDFEVSAGRVETCYSEIDFASGSLADALSAAARSVAEAGGENRTVDAEHAATVLRHRALNVIGDLYLLGRTLVGAFTGYGAGHALNIRLLEQIRAQPSAWEEISFEQEALNPISYLGPVG